MSQKIVVKRGDTLLLTCAHLQGNTPVDLGGWTLASAVRGPSGALVWRFAPRVLDAANGVFELHAAAADTARWPVGLLAADIRYTDPQGRVSTTDTFDIMVLREVTP